ncbi:hypothetical protein [Shewanella aestuarii]|uniref:Uncharacterized protein n=1 Tax=Shewanella aestuarii TaxID=1028752 RepID=A0A6G9QN91_9GAMM|nr:hypothetical protein [Shewanella aestuarii]QIR15527.1 hypothetical protein HBH39_14390 [Shewanella aestuarii]
MQIGPCWFDPQMKVLVDHKKDISWALNEQEFWVLDQLVQHRGQVVPLTLLKQVKSYNADHNNQLLSISSVEKIIDSIARFLGQNDASLIELVPHQGAVLYKRPMVKRGRLMDTPTKLMSLWQYMLIILLTLVTLSFVYSSMSPPSYIQPDYARQILSKEGNITQLLVYTDQDHHEELRDQVDVLANHLRSCETLLWQSITAALSKDRLSLNVVMKKPLERNWIFSNIKVTRPHLDEHLISPDWLKEVMICG